MHILGTAPLSPPGHQCPRPQDDFSLIETHLDGSPATRGLTFTEHLLCTEMGHGAPHLSWVVGTSSGMKRGPKVKMREREGAVMAVQGTGVPNARWALLSTWPTEPTEPTEKKGSAWAPSGQTVREGDK